ncbi:Glycosyl transferase, family 2 [Rubellimicrobium mesophilum DSM 19309]|uniref:Glycosyl transferase, family 2 n=1 Tax=Rubellimicrobium mesophilum DSM 19309 TaxID=442562 RepID=A0A017HN98_9RHOB|nr:glycosyltransferase [Rubellimicrobium mesophilum]EYD75952.1 Glycosyl transferase, family 2 [Rubellimicrobium mesophilum DSM 19309]
MTIDKAEVPTIPPIAEPAASPRWSVMIPTYESAHLAAGAIDSVLKQALPPDDMEIVVVDDASRDDIERVVAERGGRVRLHKQPSNLGVPANLTECIRLSRGQLVHILHGDDMVRPGFYAAMEKGFADPSVGAVWCRQIFMDRDGNWTGVSAIEAPEGRVLHAARFLAERQRIMTPSICVRRSVYEAVGGFHPELRCVEDWEMWVRIAARFAIGHVHEPLAVYRMHAASNTGRNLRDAAEAAYAGKAIDLFAAHLPPSEAGDVVRAARRSAARHALDTGWSLARGGDRSAGRAQAAAALRLSRDPAILLRAVYNLLLGPISPSHPGGPT